MKRSAALFIFFIISATLCHARDWDFQGAIGEPWKEDAEVGVGLELTSFHYEEPGLMEEDGILPGVRVDYGRYAPLYFQVSGRLNVGNVDYDGHLQDGTPYTTNNDDLILEVRGTIGHDFKKDDPDTAVALYGGLGLRYWNDDGSGDGHGYEREISYAYLPIGVDFAKKLDNDRRLTVQAEFDAFLGGTVESHLSDVHPAASDIENEQSSGYGARISVAYELPAGEKGRFSLEPYVRYWDIDESDLDYSGGSAWIEPANSTTEYGFAISYIW